MPRQVAEKKRHCFCPLEQKKLWKPNHEELRLDTYGDFPKRIFQAPPLELVGFIFWFLVLFCQENRISAHLFEGARVWLRGMDPMVFGVFSLFSQAVSVLLQEGEGAHVRPCLPKSSGLRLKHVM